MNERTLTFDEAFRIATTTLRVLESHGESASIAVVNRDGRLLVQLCMPGTMSYTASVAVKKALVCASTHESSRDVRDAINSGSCTQSAYNIPEEMYVPWAGGLPIFDEQGRCIGGVGVSGLSEDDDEQRCYVGVIRSGFYCGFRNSDYLDDHNPAGVRYAHHVAIQMPSSAFLTRVVDDLIERGAHTLSSQEGSRYFLRLNPSDTTLLELFTHNDGEVSFHVDYAVTSLDQVRNAFEDGQLTQFDAPIGPILFFELMKESGFLAEIGFSVRD